MPVAPKRSHPFIAVAGGIGTGKTGLVKRLATALDAVALTEDVCRNPYFDLFYEDPRRWAFHSQVSFAADALARHVQATGERAVVQDRTVYESVDVFARLLGELGNLAEKELAVLRALRYAASLVPRQPTLLIYLHAPAPVLLSRISERDRPAEHYLTHDYLRRLEQHYDTFVRGWTACPVLAVDTDERDLRDRREFEGLLAELRPMQDI